MSKKFPPGFLWGATNISHQTEGGNYKNNWYQWEKRCLVPASSIANNYWINFKETHNLLGELGVNIFRLSLEWSRIEPEEGEFNEEAIVHYKEILKDLKDKNIKTMVGLWHWSVPAWFEEKYGIHHKKSPEIFLNYAKRVLSDLGEEIDYIVIHNEPMVFVGMGYIRGEHPPFNKNIIRAIKVIRNLVTIQKEAYGLIKTKRKSILVGSAHLYNFYYPASNNSLEKLAVKFSEWFRVGYFLKRTKKHQDFIGINYYKKSGIKFDPFKKGGMLGFRETDNPHNSSGWTEFPSGIYRVLRRVYEKYKQPIIILENGKPTDNIVDDKDRIYFIEETIDKVEETLSDGVDVRGYIYHSLEDCYEWTGGYEYFFGLVQVDRKTLERKKRESFYAYKKIIERRSS